MKTMNAQKFGHSIGKLFNKVDHTLSFIPEKPRKAVVGVIACAASPVVVSAITLNALVSKTPDDLLELKEPVNNVEYSPKEPSLLDILAKLREENVPDDGEWEYGPSGCGYYVDGMKICGDDDYDDDED